MADFERVERYEGTWNGRKVSFKRVQRGRRLTDAECEALCRGEEVELPGLVGKSGKVYGIVARLADLEYEGRPYVGLEQLRFMDRDPSAKRGVPASLCGHTFTAAEKAALESGQAVHVDGMTSKKGSTFSADLTYDAAADKINFGFGR